MLARKAYRQPHPTARRLVLCEIFAKRRRLAVVVIEAAAAVETRAETGQGSSLFFFLSRVSSLLRSLARSLGFSDASRDRETLMPAREARVYVYDYLIINS